MYDSSAVEPVEFVDVDGSLREGVAIWSSRDPKGVSSSNEIRTCEARWQDYTIFKNQSSRMPGKLQSTIYQKTKRSESIYFILPASPVLDE